MPPDTRNSIYLTRYAWPGPQLPSRPLPDTGIIVVVPCFDEDNPLAALTSIAAANKPDCSVEVIIVVNHGEQSDKAIKTRNYETAAELENWSLSMKHHWLKFHVIRAFDLPTKHAGVGLARKIGMDEAVRRFDMAGQKNGIIVCYDADCVCSHNYMCSIEAFYRKNKDAGLGLLSFEHKLDTISDSRNRSAIIDYELHLRYYVQALKFAEYPYAYHTIGSCITVTTSVYQKHGGMNIRKAGEDFYFLHKLFPTTVTKYIVDATVFPSPRSSHRVPFGTGRSIMDILSKNQANYQTYHPNIFMDLKRFCASVDQLWSGDYETFMVNQGNSIQEFIATIPFVDQVSKIKQHVSSEKQFIKSFYTWFNGFMILKFVHFARDHHYGKMGILEACHWLISQSTTESKPDDKETMLILMRELDRSE